MSAARTTTAIALLAGLTLAGCAGDQGLPSSAPLTAEADESTEALDPGQATPAPAGTQDSDGDVVQGAPLPAGTPDPGFGEVSKRAPGAATLPFAATHEQIIEHVQSAVDPDGEHMSIVEVSDNYGPINLITDRPSGEPLSEDEARVALEMCRETEWLLEGLRRNVYVYDAQASNYYARNNIDATAVACHLEQP